MSLSWEELEFMGPEKRGWTLPIPPTCARCGYILTGLTSDRCPECGTSFSLKDVRSKAHDHWHRIQRLGKASGEARLGLIINTSGWVMIGLFRLPGLREIAFVVDGLAFIAAIFGIFLGWQIFGVRKVPHSLREYIEGPPPNVNLGIAALLTGLSLLAGSVLLPVP